MEQQAAVLETMKGQTAALQEEADADTAKLKEIQDYLLTGVSSGSGAGQSYNDQLMGAQWVGRLGCNDVFSDVDFSGKAASVNDEGRDQAGKNASFAPGEGAEAISKGIQGGLG